ncbi:hypothetical protein R3P38DRAFT_3207420 [Favolaschia claudopus]|uniref:Hydrophobin n=1 Tax=Favolaschia claudopus TaxID=2862362 RepID=A0AAW0AK49_9AGAR
MFFKPFVLLASALAALQVAHSASFAERNTEVCCASIVNPSVTPFLYVLIAPELAGAGVSLDPSLAVGVQCTTAGIICVPGVTLMCEVVVHTPLAFFGNVGVNCVAS